MVIDPVQSVKGKVVIDAFRLIPAQQQMMLNSEPRQTTSNVGYLKKTTTQARIHGLDRYYYSMVVDWRKNDLEEQMLMNLHKKDWTSGLFLTPFGQHQSETESLLDDIKRLSTSYITRLQEESESGKTQEQLEVMNVGKTDPRKHLENDVTELMSVCVVQCLGAMIDTVVF